MPVPGYFPSVGSDIIVQVYTMMGIYSFKASPVVHPSTSMWAGLWGFFFFFAKPCK